MDLLPSVNANLPVDSSLLDPYKIISSGQTVDPELFKLYLTASMTNLDALFGEEKEDKDDIFNTNSLFSNPYSQSPTEISSSTSVFNEMIARANLIGKTVDAYDPETGNIFTGRVSSVTVDGGKVAIVVGEKKIPPENLISIKE